MLRRFACSPEMPARLRAIVDKMPASPDRSSSVLTMVDWLKSSGRRARIPAVPTTIILSCVIGRLLRADAMRRYREEMLRPR